jgi:hypothetical protein
MAASFRSTLAIKNQSGVKSTGPGLGYMLGRRTLQQ